MHSDTFSIPDEDISTHEETYDPYISTQIPVQEQFCDKNYAQSPEWQFVFSGKTQGEKIQSEISQITKSSNIVIDGVKGFFNKILESIKGIEK